MGWFERKGTKYSSPPVESDLEDIANHWIELNRGQAGGKIEDSHYDNLGRVPSSISGGANGKDIEKARTQQPKMKLRDLLFADVREVYSVWRQKYQQGAQDQLAQSGQPERSIKREDLPLQHTGDPELPKEHQRLDDQGAERGQDPLRSPEERLNYFEGLDPLAASESKYLEGDYETSERMLADLGLSDQQITNIWEGFYKKQQGRTDTSSERKLDPKENTERYQLPDYEQVARKAEVVVEEGTPRDPEEIAYQMFLKGEDFTAVLERTGYDQERRLTTRGMFLEKAYKQAKDALESSESLARSILTHVHSQEYIDSLIGNWGLESASHGREETYQRLMNLFDKWDVERADEELREAVETTVQRLGRIRETYYDGDKRSATMQLRRQLNYTANETNEIFNLWKQQNPRAQTEYKPRTAINLLSTGNVEKRARMVYAGDKKESKRILRESGHGYQKRRVLVNKWEQELSTAEGQAETAFYENKPDDFREILRKVGYNGNQISGYLSELQRDQAAALAREKVKTERISERQEAEQKKSQNPLMAILQNYLFGESRKPSIGINLAPTEKQLQAYREAEIAYINGNYNDADEILTSARYNSSTISELKPKWDKKISQIALVAAAQYHFMQGNDSISTDMLKGSGVTLRQSDKLRAKWSEEKEEQRREAEELAKKEAEKAERLERKEAKRVEKEAAKELARYEREEDEDSEPVTGRRFRYVFPSLLVAGALIAAGSIGYEYMIKPYIGRQSVQRSEKQEQKSTKEQTAKTESEQQKTPATSVTKSEEKPTFHALIAPPVTSTIPTPSTTAPAQPRTEQPAPAAPEPTRKPTGMPTYFTYENVYGEKQRILIHASRWLIDNIDENPKLNSESLLLNTFYDANRNGQQEWVEPSLPVYVTFEGAGKSEYLNSLTGLKRGNRQVYLLFTENAVVNPIKDGHGNILRIEIPSSYVEFSPRN